MKTRIGQSARLSYSIAVASVFLTVATLVAVTMIASPSMSFLTAELQRHDGRLAAISDRASRMQQLMRYVHKVNLPAAPEVADLPFVGFAGTASAVAVGKKLRLGPDGTMDILHSERVNSPINIASTMSRQIKLMVLTVRVTQQPEAPSLQVVVAVTPVKSRLAPDEPRTL